MHIFQGENIEEDIYNDIFRHYNKEIRPVRLISSREYTGGRGESDTTWALFCIKNDRKARVSKYRSHPDHPYIIYSVYELLKELSII